MSIRLNSHLALNILNKYLQYQYKADARGDDGFIDCWGLTRLARHELYDKALLPSFAQASHSKPGTMHAAYATQAQVMQTCERKEGAVVAALRNGMCLHVALVVGDNAILEIKREGQRARLTPWREFVRQYPAPRWELRFYD